MVSNSQTSSSADTVTEDQRQLVSDEAVAVGAGSTVTITEVADEAFDLGGDALQYGADLLTDLGGQAFGLSGDVVRQMGDIVAQSKRQERSEFLQFGETLVTFGIPAALIYFALKR